MYDQVTNYFGTRISSEKGVSWRHFPPGCNNVVMNATVEFSTNTLPVANEVGDTSV